MINIALLDCGIIENPKRSRSLKIIEKINALNLEIERVRVLKNEVLSDKLSNYTHVIISGSGLDFDSDNFGIKYVRETISKLTRTNTLVLGICFGAQVIADVLGGEVVKKENGEFGFVNISFNSLDSISENSIFAKFPRHFDAFEYHFDYIKSLPENFKMLAKSEKCIQAFSYHNFYGVQFHPEVDGEFAQREVDIIKDKKLTDNVKSVNNSYSLPSRIFENFLNLKN